MADPDDPRIPSRRPGEAIAEQGAVLLDGPRGAALTLTPEAAQVTGENLRRAAVLAARQRGSAGRTAQAVHRLRRTEPEERETEPDGSDPQG